MPPSHSRPFLLLLLLVLTTLVDAAHSRRRPVASPQRSGNDKYDRSITTFDASGRLLQVEYGRTAANRGVSSILAYLHQSHAAADGTKDSSDVAKHQQSLRLHESIYILVSPSSSSSFQIHRLDHHIFLATTGLAGDGLFLASHLRKHCQSCRQAYGQAPTTQQVAQQAARVQHYLTRTTGARPLGVTAVVLGFDDTFDHGDDDTVECARIVRTDPGGVLQDCHYYAAGQHQDAILRTMPETAERLLQQEHNVDDKTTTLSRHAVVTALAQIMADAAANKELPLDVWILERNTSCRGNLQATCLLNVKANDCNGNELQQKLEDI